MVEQAEIHRMAGSEVAETREAAIYLIRSRFSALPNKQAAWSDLIRITHDKNRNMRRSAVNVLHSVFFYGNVLLEMQDEWKSKAPLLTLTDVREIFEVIMPKRHVSDREILKLIEKKHKARYSAKLSHHKRGG